MTLSLSASEQVHTAKAALVKEQHKSTSRTEIWQKGGFVVGCKMSSDVKYFVLKITF